MKFKRAVELRRNGLEDIVKNKDFREIHKEDFLRLGIPEERIDTVLYDNGEPVEKITWYTDGKYYIQTDVESNIYTLDELIELTYGYYCVYECVCKIPYNNKKDGYLAYKDEAFHTKYCGKTLVECIPFYYFCDESIVKAVLDMFNYDAEFFNGDNYSERWIQDPDGNVLFVDDGIVNIRSMVKLNDWGGASYSDLFDALISVPNTNVELINKYLEE